MIAFPQSRLASLTELASRVLETRRSGSGGDQLARDLLTGFFDLCTRWGLDRVLHDLEQAFPPLDLDDRLALAEHADLRQSLVEKLERTFDFGDLGPRNAKPKQLTDCLAATLTLAPTEEPDRTITLDDKVRTEVLAALASVVDVELAVPQIRETIIADARARCPDHLEAFDRMAAQLDERGMRITRQLKIPIHAVQAVERALAGARTAIIDRIAGAAIDRARQVIARADDAAAARIDQPITYRATPRAVAILRVDDPRASKQPAAVVQSLIESLTELAHLAWRAAERPVRAYSAKQTFAVGDLVEHPKFGRGSVISTAAHRIEVEFPDGKLTLVHASK